jgi:hypothetical protein
MTFELHFYVLPTEDVLIMAISIFFIFDRTVVTTKEKLNKCWFPVIPNKLANNIYLKK